MWRHREHNRLLRQHHPKGADLCTSSQADLDAIAHYERASTDRQSTARQNLVLTGDGIGDPVTFEEEGGPPAASTALAAEVRRAADVYAAGRTVHTSEMFRLVRGTQHILHVLDFLHRERLALRIHDGAFSAMDLTACHRAPENCCPR
ncbi:hypothetical protein ACIA98_34670 [Streptomyces sp. NPDC051366]|uniref:hypothetical protein n=1 Tax=Streptomyces sp. NPDC051366 TaxID=3365652 RepID=UPI0037A4F035